VATARTSVRIPPARLAKWLVALALLGVSVAFGVPVARDFAARASVVTGADALLEAFHLARMEALARNAQVTVCKQASPRDAFPGCAQSSAQWSEGWVVFVDGGTIGKIDAADEVISTGRAAGTIDAISERPMPVASITFNPVGPITGPASHLEVRIASSLSRGSFERVVCLSLLGRAHVSKSGACQP
jgi:type IV fimbrial biogenesis protein FimT